VAAAPVREAAPTAGKAGGMVAEAPDGVIELRDRALLMLGFTGAFRRSALVALMSPALRPVGAACARELAASRPIRRTKASVLASSPGTVACPVKAQKAWRSAAALTTRALFRPVPKSGRILNVRASANSGHSPAELECPPWPKVDVATLHLDVRFR
jgi:hypothetical protein